MKIEQRIKKSGREQFYEYYLSLGYDHKTAASLALFTYGDHRFNEFSIDALYDALCKGEEYLPPEEIEKRRRMEEHLRKRREHLRRSVMNTPASAPKMMSSPPEPEEYFEEALDGVEIKCEPESVLCLGVEACEVLEESESYVAPTSGGMGIMDLVGAPGFATYEYENIEEKGPRSTAVEPTSTFRMTTNTASAGVVLNQLRNGRRIDKSMVRIEELLNYFRYESKIPEKEMFNISHELMDGEDGKKYLYINVQGREEVKEKQNIIILLDVSGSMHGNTEQTQAIIATIISKLGNGDKLSIITYSDDDIIELEAFTVNGYEDRISALEKLLSIEITGCTYGSKGIESAYKIGKKNYIEGGNNQVILITDGDLNFGIRGCTNERGHTSCKTNWNDYIR